MLVVFLFFISMTFKARISHLKLLGLLFTTVSNTEETERKESETVERDNMAEEEKGTLGKTNGW